MFRSGFFTSDSWTVNGDGFAIGNKAEGSDFLAKIVSVAVTDGVPYLPTSNLQVTATTGMILSVGAGFGFKDGYMAWETADTTITCTSSASEQTLYISARLDTTTGEFTGGKVDKYTTFVAATDICFAIVVIPANAVTITSAMITDVRGNATYCGYITDQREYLETLTAWLQNEIANVIAGGMPDHASTHAAIGDDPITPASINAASLDGNSKVTATEASSSISVYSDSGTLALTDAGKLVKVTKGTAATITIPLHAAVAFPVGTEIEIVQYGAGQVSIAITSGGTLYSAGSAKKTRVQYVAVSIKCIAQDEWLLTGDLTA